MQTVCIYHAECIDGASSAAVVKHKFPDAEMIPAIHGDAPPSPEQVKGKQVFVVDFSFSADIFRQLKSHAAEIYWYDHHKTALPIRDELGFGVLDLNESGATLTWKELFPKRKMPLLLNYVRDKDLWKWELPDSRDINADIRDTEGILDPTHAVWKYFLKGISKKNWDSMIERGRRSRRLLRQRLEKAGKKGFVINLDGFQGFAVNWTEDASEVGEYIYQELKHPIALIFSYNGKDWVFSLRSNTLDVAEIAVRHGGGGHPGAAGFRTPTIEWLFASQ